MPHPRRVDEGDELQISHKRLAGRTFRVEDTEVQNLGVADLFVAALVSDEDQVYTMAHAEGSKEVSIEPKAADSGINVSVDAVNRVNDGQ